MANKKESAPKVQSAWEKNFEEATEHVSAAEKKALEDENKRGLEDKKRLEQEASENKKGSNEDLHKKNEEAENGPEGAQKNQPLPEDVDIKATAKAESKPQNTAGKQL